MLALKTVLRVQRIQATYRGHVIRARVRRDMGEAFQVANRRRRRPRNLLEVIEKTLDGIMMLPHGTSWALGLSLAMIPSVTSSSSSRS